MEKVKSENKSPSWDLKNLLDLVQASFKEKNYEEALKAALLGLDMAVDQGQEEWKERFEGMYSDLKAVYDTEIKCKTSMDGRKIGEQFKTTGQFEAKPNNLDAWVPLGLEGIESDVYPETERENSLDGDDLAEVKGIGERNAGMLTKAGITTVQQLADSSIEELSRIKGIGALTAKKLLDSASVFLDSGIETDFELKNAIRASENEAIVEQESLRVEQFGEPELVLEPFDDDPGSLQDVGDDAKNLDAVTKALEVKSRENVPEIKNTTGELNANANSTISNFLSDDLPINYNLDGTNEIYQEPPREAVQKSIEQEKEVENEGNGKAIRTRNDEFREEVLELNEVKGLGRKVKMALESSGFGVIPRKLMTDRYRDVDFVALKLIKVKELLDVFLVVPVKISALKGRTIVSEKRFDYLAHNHSLKFTTTDKKLLVGPYLRKLERIRNAICDDLSGESKLIDYISNYLKKDVVAEKTASSKTLFLRTGQLEHVVTVDPVLACANETGCAEKSIKFPYHEGSNIHVVSVDKLPKLLNFLEAKYYQLEKRSEKNNSLHLYFESLTSFVTNLRLATIPFIAFGFIFLATVLFQVKEAFQLFTSLGIACTFALTAIGACLYYNFYKKKSIAKEEFNTPYFKRPVHLTESSLLLIKEAFSPETMEQFVYECYGKKLKGNLIKFSEEMHEKKDRLLKKKENKTLSNERVTSAGGIEQARDAPSALIGKYSSFLED